MNEIQVYRKLYGDLIKCVPHYKYRIRITAALYDKNLYAGGVTYVEIKTKTKKGECNG